MGLYSKIVVQHGIYGDVDVGYIYEVSFPN
jgi:hypothetical protein